ncbi:MAG: tetratricopeptide repeat protein [Cyanobacteria bacterium J06638_22]
MIDTSSQPIFGLNHQTYLRLKLALSLNMRRQIFLAVCDDLPLRDRLADHLQQDLRHPRHDPRHDHRENADLTYPRLVGLNLSLESPNPVVQIAQWLSFNPLPRSGKRRLPLPAFQFLGIEHLTRQSATVQRQFLAHLQDIERSLPVLDCSLLFWMPRPWFRMLPQSAPEFWRCRTAIFEFMGDPRPLAAERDFTPVEATPDRPKPIPDVATDAPPEDLSDASSTQSHYSNGHGMTKPPSKLAASAAKSEVAEEVTEAKSRAAQSISLLSVTPVALKERQPDVPIAAEALIEETPPTEVAAEAPQGKLLEIERLEPQEDAEASNPDVAETDEDADLNPFPALVQEVASPPADPELNIEQLRQYVRQLHQQNAPAAVIAEAYRVLGDRFRDRAEQGDVTLDGLEDGIHAYEQVLIWLPETSLLWADVLNDLGNLHWMLSRHRSQPDAAINQLAQAVQAYETGLTRLIAAEQPQTAAMLQNNLGAAYADLARYETPIEHLKKSVQAYQQVLAYRSADTDPARYASTQNNLGATLWTLAQHEQPKHHLTAAIAAYTEALNHCIPEEDPSGYGMVQNNLGTALWNLAQYEQPEHWLKQAIAAYNIALTYRTAEVSLLAHAATQNNLGTAFWHLANQEPSGDNRLSYWNQAIAAYDAAIDSVAKLEQQSGTPTLNFDIYASYTNLGLAHYQLATDSQLLVPIDDCTQHLETALQYHVVTLSGWQDKPHFRQTAISHIIKTVRALYRQGGLDGQNRALSIVPAELIPELLPRL